jgi:hypothetical protein
MASDGGAFGRDDRAGEGYALAAFRPTTKPGIGAAGGCTTFAGDLFQVLFTDGIADTDNHADLLNREIA